MAFFIATVIYIYYDMYYYKNMADKIMRSQQGRIVPFGVTVFFIMIFESLVATIWFATEAVVFKIRKKTEKLNSNLLLLFLIAAFWVYFFS